jgi:hypothetical protein
MFQAIGDIDENRNFKMAVASANELPGTNIDSLLTISFEVEPNVENKVYSIKLQNILLEYDSVKHDDPSDVLVRVRVCMLGDANRDNKVNVIDVTLIINYILNRDSGLEYNALLADMNEDGFIDIFDIMKLINVVVNGKMPVVDEIMARAAVAPQYEDMELAFIKNGVTMSIPNAQRFSSFQFDIEVPDDIELKDTKLIGVNTNHIIQFAKTDYCQYRVVCLSLDNSILESDGKDFLILDIPNCGKVKIHDAMFVNSQGIATYFCDKEIDNGITGINSTVTSKDDSVFDLSGRKVKNENRHLHKGIYIINNKRVVVK